jgi:hypothetical protein
MGLELSDFTGLRKLKENEWMAICPCHDDKNGSLHVTKIGNKILYHCFAHCDGKKISHALRQKFYRKEKRNTMTDKIYLETINHNIKIKELQITERVTLGKIEKTGEIVYWDINYRGEILNEKNVQ